MPRHAPPMNRETRSGRQLARGKRAADSPFARSIARSHRPMAGSSGHGRVATRHFRFLFLGLMCLVTPIDIVAEVSPAHAEHINRLAREKSPYLLQHAHNPVDWYSWGEEAFAKARRENKPIFLSVGYSTCHWCHVMAHESFENEETAAIMNREFVNIKVDREERPDVDRVYMTFVQATTGSGGWPMSVWLTPDLKPFYGGTYFPPSSQWGRPGFVDILRQISRVWRGERSKVIQSAEAMTKQLRTLEQPSPAWTVPGADALTETV